MAPSSQGPSRAGQGGRGRAPCQAGQGRARQRTIAIVSLVVGIVVVVSLVLVILNNGKSATPSAQVAPSVATGHGGVVFDARVW